ncbi:MAG: hypothetical protein AAGF27_06430 [Pseudomonadota bacterium]
MRSLPLSLEALCLLLSSVTFTCAQTQAFTMTALMRAGSGVGFPVVIGHDRVSRHIPAFAGEARVEGFEGPFENPEKDKTQRRHADAGVPKLPAHKKSGS